MFCPQCQCEYQEGFTKCSHCGVQLVDIIETVTEDQSKAQYIEYEYLFSIRNPADIAFIKSILDSDNIVYHFMGENAVSLTLMSSRLLVKKDQVERAKELLKDTELKYTKI